MKGNTSPTTCFLAEVFAPQSSTVAACTARSLSSLLAAYPDGDGGLRGIAWTSGDGAATVFALQDLTVDAAHQQLTARGRLTTYIGERRVSEIQKTYTLTFDTNAGRIVLTSFKEATPRDPLDPRPDAPAGT